MTIPARLWTAAAVLFLLPLALWLATRPLDARLGLSARYYPTADWQGQAVTRIDPEITTRSLRPPATVAPDGAFSARWDGYLHVDRSGPHVFQLVSDDGSWLEIDGKVVIDNGGRHSPILKQETVHLREGLHVIGLTHFQGAGGWRLDLLSAPEGQRLQTLAAPLLLNRPMAGWTYTVASALHSIRPYLPLCWSVSILLAAIALAIPLLRHLQVTHALSDHGLRAVLLLSLVLNAVGIWWGLGWRWAPDEILPSHVIEAIDHRFSNGWSGPYPPFHYYILGLAYAPFLVAEQMSETRVAFPMHLTNRLVSLMMAAGIIVACYLCGKALRGRNAGLAAAALTALLLPFVYYAKTGNLDVPYLFWFSWAMLFYIRIILTGEPAAYTGFAVAGALAIVTKDQAFGFFVAPCIHVAVLRYRRMARMPGSSVLQVLRDSVVPRTALVGVVTLAVAYNLPFNWSGFTAHVNEILGNASGKYRMVDSTLQGQWTLLKYSLAQVRFAFGWPALVVVLAGLISSMRTADRRTRFWLLLPVVSYYCFFVAPTSIVFDRFVLGICMIMAIIAGCAVADWLQAGGRVRQAALACVCFACAYSVVRAVSFDALMVSDSRYHVEQWVRAEVPRDAGIAAVGPQSTLPRLEWGGGFDLRSPDPPPNEFPYLVLNATYAERFDSSTPEGASYDRIRKSGDYTLLLQHRNSRIWPPLSRDPVFRDVAEDWFTNLDKVNPLIEVYKRNDRARH